MRFKTRQVTRLGMTTGICIVMGVSLTVTALAEPVAESVRVAPRENWVAGSKDTIEVVYTAGAEGIPSGGSLGLAFKHAIHIKLSPTPGAPGYVKAVRASGDPLTVSVLEWPSQGAFSYPPGQLSQPCTDADALTAAIRYSVYAKVGAQPIAPGEEVRFILGADNCGVEIPPNVCEYPMRLLVDPEGDGTYRISPCVPQFRIVAGPLDHFWVTIPSTRRTGETADINIRAEDKLNCVADSHSGEVTLTGMPGLPAGPVVLKSGMARVEVKCGATGVRRVTVAGAGLTAQSNPMVVSNKQPYQVYWGDLHVHTTSSDALGGDPDYAYTYARDCADLDVCALADHAPREPSRLATRKFNQDGRFVTLWGYEWAESEPGRLDRNIYFHSEDDPIPVGWPKRIEDFWKSLESAYGDNRDHRVIVGPHMFTYQTKSRPWHETWDDRYERFVEIYSEHGMSEFLGNPRMLADGNVQEGFFMQDGLAQGRKFGIIGSSDTHDSRAGRGSNSLRYRGGLVAFLAKDLTRESIWDAFWNRRVYGATNDRICIDFQINGHPMGEVVETARPPKIAYKVHGCSAKFDVYLIKDNQVLWQTASQDQTVAKSATDTTFDKDSVYYLRVAQDNGEYAWSSPIWVKKVGGKPR